MTVLLDTNLLLRASDRGHTMYAVATEALIRLDIDNQECVLVPQVLYEFWVVATRPLAVNGLELSISDAKLAIEKWTTAYPVLLDERGVYRIFRSIELVSASKLVVVIICPSKKRFVRQSEKSARQLKMDGSENRRRRHRRKLVSASDNTSVSQDRYARDS